MRIRTETINDYENVYQLIKTAFATAEHSDGSEQDLVTALRKGDAFIPELSLVAENNGKVIGYILFTKIKIGSSIELALAPLAVLPEYQKLGVGTELMKTGHEIAQKLGYHYSVVLGSETYYPRVGYVPAKEYGILAPFKVPSENYMAYTLNPGNSKIRGVVTYAKEFGIEE